ncbi:MAG: hypothetical protein LBK47_04170 [Prevotellaceae bacterium]|jgi:hypothetical protein|nr:hypothetical protein [Prevotellaceae bacterium]
MADEADSKITAQRIAKQKVRELLLTDVSNMGISFRKKGKQREAADCYKRAARLGVRDAQDLLHRKGKSW